MDLDKFFVKAELIPAVIQEESTGEVLMLAYMNKESLAKTLETGYTWFFSRSRQKLWNKGESSGHFLPQCEQGKLSRYAETISDELMKMDSSVRQYATLGIMNVFQKYLGEGIPVNGDSVSLEKTIAGIGITIGAFFRNPPNFKDIYKNL